MGDTLLEGGIIFVGAVWWFESQIEGALSNLIDFEFIFITKQIFYLPKKP